MASATICVTIVKWIPVLFVTLLFLWSTYAYIVQMCLYMVTDLIERIIYIVIFSLLLFMTLWCFIKSIFTPAATVPFQYYLTTEEKEQAAKSKSECKEVVENKGIKLRVQGRTVRGCVRYCEECKCVKPDRAHHCSNCQKCILKMDHHCPWINNCVCYTNYKFFFLFLMYTFIFCLYCAATSCQYFVRFWASYRAGTPTDTTTPQPHHPPPHHPPPLSTTIATITTTISTVDMLGMVNVLVLFLVACCMGLSVVILCGYHVEMLFKNRTTLESLRAPIFRSGPDKNAYNRGCRKNFIEVFGRSPCLWFIPVFTDMGDGVTFTARISPIPIGYRTMDLTTPSSITMTTTPKVDTQIVQIQPSGDNSGSPANEYSSLQGDNEELKIPVRIEKRTKFM